MIQPADSTEIPKGRKHMVEFDQEEVIAALVKAFPYDLPRQAFPYDLPRAQVIPNRTSMVIDTDTGVVRVTYETIKPK